MVDRMIITSNGSFVEMLNENADVNSRRMSRMTYDDFLKEFICKPIEPKKKRITNWKEELEDDI